MRFFPSFFRQIPIAIVVISAVTTVILSAWGRHLQLGLLPRGHGKLWGNMALGDCVTLHPYSTSMGSCDMTFPQCARACLALLSHRQTTIEPFFMQKGTEFD
jgi:hypothetical protein